MTRIVHGTNGNSTFETELWYLLNPPTGLGTFHGTFSETNGIFDVAVSMSYAGVAQTAPILGSVTANGSEVTSFGIGRTLTGTNSWFIGGGNNDGLGSMSVGNSRVISSGSNVIGGDNTIGTLGFNNGGTSTNWIGVAAEVAPFVSTANVAVGYISLLGVGQV